MNRALILGFALFVSAVGFELSGNAFETEAQGCHRCSGRQHRTRCCGKKKQRRCHGRQDCGGGCYGYNNYDGTYEGGVPSAPQGGVEGA